MEFLKEMRHLAASFNAGCVPLRHHWGNERPARWIFCTRTQDDCFYATFAGLFTTGVHTKNAGEMYPSVIDFCDCASAGNTWGDDSSFRVWLPIEKKPESL